jgi:hypothetical protein
VTAPTRAPSPEDADWYRYIGREWRRINACLYDERIKAMFHALKAQCKDPDAPTNTEGGQVRMALIEEIDALGIEPRWIGGADG